MKRRQASLSYRRKPVSTAEVRPGPRRDDTKRRRFTIEELVAGMVPDKEHPLEDDWPVGEELIQLVRIEARSPPRLGALKPPATSGALLRELRNFVLPWRTLTIGIDGRMGAGKSTFGRFIAWQLGMPLIETDMWMLRRHVPIGYRYSQLAAIVRARRAHNRPIIIEGIKLLETLERIDVCCDFLIWLRSNDDPTSAEELSDILRSGTRVADVESYVRSYDPESHASRVLKIVPAE